MRRSRARFVTVVLPLVALWLSLGLVSTARAQSTTDGAIGGTVFDQTGAVVPEATVVVHNNGTDLEQTQVTDAAGFYKALHLPPAVYTVTVTAKGFETFKAEQVIVTVGSVTTISPHLAVGATTQTVEVSGVAPQVNTTGAEFASTLNQTAVADLPIQRARWSAFSQLTPGVVQDSNGFGLLSFRGMSTLLNNVTVDGADDNEAFFSEQRGRTRASYSESEDQVQEFQVNTSNYSAEYGRAAGGVVNTVTKSGSNQFHGDISYKNRENGWASRNPFTTETFPTSTGNVTYPIKPTDYWDMEAGSIGGPIKRDKLFFFFTYDNFYRDFPGVSVASNPTTFNTLPVSPTTLAGAGGTCSAVNNTSPGKLSSNITSKNSIFSSTAAYNATVGACAIAGIVEEGLTATSSPNPYSVSYATGYTDYVAGLNGLLTNLGTSPRTAKQDIIFPKLDWQINEKNRASFEFNRMRWISPYGVQTQATNSYSIGAAMGDDNVSVTWGIGKLYSFITPTVSNEFRYQIGMDFEWESAPPLDAYEINEELTTKATPAGGVSTPASGALATPTQYPSWATYTNPSGASTYANISGGFSFGTAYYDLRYAYPRELRNQVADTVTWMHGNHSLKFGGDFNHVQDELSNIKYQEGYYSYGSVSAYLEDLYAPPACSGHPCATNYNSFNEGFGTLTWQIPTADYALFVQDDWKVRPRLTLSLGLRWEYEHLPPPPFPNPAVPATTHYPNDKKDFGPRFGFAWDVFGDGKTAVRGGFGIYYGRILNSTLWSVMSESGLIQNGIVAGQPAYSTNAPPSGSTGGGYFPEILTAYPAAGGTPIPSIMYYNPHYHNPEIDEVDFVVERNIGWNTVFSLNYMGSFGHMLPQTTDDNLTQGTNSAGANPTLTYLVAGGGPITTPTYTTPFYAYRPNPNFNLMVDIFGVSSNYNALVIEAKHRLSHSVQFDAHFTWAHALDADPGTISSTTIFATGYNLLYPNNVGLMYGNSDLDIPKRFVLDMVANSPWRVHGPLRWLLNDWQFSPIFEAQNGLPWTAYVSGNAPGSLASAGDWTGTEGAGGNLPMRNNYFTPGSEDLDIHLSKTIPIKEKLKLELFAEAYNLFNHFNTTGVNEEAYSVATSGTISDTTGTTQTCSKTTPCLSLYSTPLGQPTSANSTYQYWTRQLQFGARLSF